MVPRPNICSNYHEDANTVDVLNHLRQSILQLEKKWTTKDGNFRIATGLAGMTAVDVFHLGQHHGIIDKGTSDTLILDLFYCAIIYLYYIHYNFTKIYL